MSKTTPLYLRLPSELKEQVDRMAAASDASLTTAVAQLVDAGLRNTDDQMSHLRDRVTVLEGEVRDLRDERDAVCVQLAQVHEEVSRNRMVIESVVQRLKLQVGTCPKCHVAVTGQQVFVDGACSNGHNLQTSALASAPKSTLSQPDLLAALAVVGVALGLAVMASRN